MTTLMPVIASLGTSQDSQLSRRAKLSGVACRSLCRRPPTLGTASSRRSAGIRAGRAVVEDVDGDEAHQTISAALAAFEEASSQITPVRLFPPKGKFKFVFNSWGVRVGRYFQALFGRQRLVF